MTDTPATVDRRTQIKARHRRSIIDAAAALMRERWSSDFSVDELAQAADVSRRTIFNHFASLDDVLVEVFGIELGTVVDRLAAHAPSTTDPDRTVFDELADGFRATDLVSPMVYLTRILGNEDPAPSPRQAQLAARAFTAISERLTREMLHRHPGSDPFTVTLMISSVTHGVMVTYSHWAATCGAVDTDASRDLWSRLMERLLESFRTGFGAS